MHLNKFYALFILSFLISSLFAISDSSKDYADSRDSGGKPVPEQEKYDVGFYDLHLTIDPDNKWIGGYLEMKATTLENLEMIVVNLDTLLKISKVEVDDHTLSFLDVRRKEGRVYIKSVKIYKPGELFKLKIHYEGHPLWVKNATRSPFKDGFYFEKTENNQHWVGNVSVLPGADVWWPCKDLPSDEPDSMGIHIRTSQDLVVASNGKLMDIEQHDDSTHTYHWFVSYPINNYGVTVNLGPYKTIRKNIKSVSGNEFPFIVYVLPETYEKAKTYFPFMIRDLEFLESLLGPFPFYRDKSAIAQTFYIGMETQSIIAFGSDFENRSYGFNFVHLHELAHEWFANMVTAKDWKHMWIHEGFVTYIEALYAEYLDGVEGYRKYMDWRMSQISYDKPIVLEKEYVPIREAYHMDIYYKGAATLHSLRFLIGKDLMIESLRRFAYPNPELEKVEDNSHIRFSNTEEYIQIVEKLSGKELNWFFDAYLYYAKSPRLKIKQLNDTIQLAWQTESDYTFKLAVPVMIDGTYKIISMENGNGFFNFTNRYEIDPYNEILRQKFTLANIISEKLKTNGVDAAMALHNSLITSKPDSIVFFESSLNRLGYQYLSRGQVKNAMAVFRMNINAYPESPNCYDSMADAFKQFGDLEKAKEFFEQAVKIAEKKEDSELSVYQSRLEKINILLKDNN